MTASGSFLRASSASSRGAGIVAPHIDVKRFICSAFVIGMMPGTIGTSIPAARASSTKRKYASLSKNSCVMRTFTPASTFSFRWARSLARSAASGCTSG